MLSLSIPLNGFYTRDNWNWGNRILWYFQFHWMDSGFLLQLRADLELSIAFNSIEWILAEAYGISYSAVVLSIPLNGFYNVSSSPHSHWNRLSIPLNGFGYSHRHYATTSSSLLLSIPLNGFEEFSYCSPRADCSPFQFHWMDSGDSVQQALPGEPTFNSIEWIRRLRRAEYLRI